MAKSKKTPPAETSEGAELIVIVKPGASLRSAGPSVTSASGTKVTGLNSVLKTHGASFIPIFGSENRIPNMAKASTAAFEKASIDPASFYFVKAEGNLNKLATTLLNEGTVEAAYVKPRAEPPVMIDENMPPTASEEAPPTTPSFVARQLYLEVAPGGIDARYAWTLAGGKGDLVRIVDVEGAWRYTHEDLMVNQGGVIAGTPSTDIAWRNHGTAVIGEFGGDENAIGITGICPNANTRSVSIFGSTGSALAIRTAADALGAGDIILIELHRPGPRFAFANRSDQLGYIAVEWWPDDFAAILYAVSRGVIVVEAGGNGAENLSDPFYNTRPSGFPTTWTNPFNTANPTSNAVLVGAGAPPPGTHGRNYGPDRSRLDFSNYGARVDCQGWGREVTTAGYGDLQGGSNEDFWYTDVFSGTSSASPIIVGTLGCIQGRLRNRSKPLLTPATARNILRTTGSPQQDATGRPATQRIGNRPNLRQAFTTLGVGGIIKGVKEVKEFIKEKDFTKEIKDKDKEAKEIIKEKDIKEFKEKEVKEIKEKDHKEFKEKDHKEIKEKDIFEKIQDKALEKTREVFGGGGVFVGGGVPGQTVESSLESRMQNLESIVQQLSHFISSENRPDLQTSLYNQGSSQENEFQKNSYDAKAMKDNKEMDTM
jgi:hypothetical protein